MDQDTNGEVTKTQENTTLESQYVSPFPAGDHKAAMNRQDSITKTNMKHNQQKRSKKEVPPWNCQQNITGGHERV